MSAMSQERNKNWGEAEVINKRKDSSENKEV